MDAQAPGLGDGIDQARERRLAGKRVVVAFGVVGAMAAAESRRHRRRVQASGVDHHVRVKVEAAAAYARAAAPAFEIRRLGEERNDAPGGLEVAHQTQHVGMAVDDAGGFRIDPGQRVHLRFQGKDLAAAQPGQFAGAVDARLSLVVLQHAELRLGRGDDDLADAPMRHVAAGAVLVEQRLAAHACRGLERPRGVVEAGVDDFGVAAGGLRADRVVAFEHQHLAPGFGEGARHREADRAGADHHRVAAFGHAVRPP